MGDVTTCGSYTENGGVEFSGTVVYEATTKVVREVPLDLSREGDIKGAGDSGF